ncbi:hypothetical protein V6N12_005391, partial [Hibiscus sabdariffa]
MADDPEIVYVLHYFHGDTFRTNPKFEYENGAVEIFHVDPDRLCLWDIVENVKLLKYDRQSFVYYRVLELEFNCDSLVLIHNDDTYGAEGSINKISEDSKETDDSEDNVTVDGEELGADFLDFLDIEELHADCEGIRVLANKEILPSIDEVLDDVCEDLGTEIDVDSNSELKEDDG